MIDFFNGNYRFLSNFWLSPFVHESVQYISVEHAYQAWKMLYTVDFLKVITAPTPGEAKKLGRVLTLHSLATDERAKVTAMKTFVNAKFIQNPDLMRQLLETGEQELVEGNNWNDTFWGVCQGKGENRLGHILMALRDEYRKISTLT